MVVCARQTLFDEEPFAELSGKKESAVCLLVEVGLGQEQCNHTEFVRVDVVGSAGTFVLLVRNLPCECE